MNLVSALELLKEAEKKHFAIAAFNVENMETIQAVVMASNQEKTPVIIQTTPASIRYAGLKSFYHNVIAACSDTDTPVALHLDHGSSFELAMQAMRWGYTSVMFDGSTLSFEENIRVTRQVADVGRASGITVEAELGSVGGKEDDLEVEKSGLTDPDQAAEFAERSQTHTLAVAIGTAHGIYKGEPKLDLDRLKAIRGKVNIPLVLHGTSGVPTDVVKKCIDLGISKVNYATDLRVAFSSAVKKSILENPENFDPKVYLGAGREAVFNKAVELIRLCKN